MIRKLKEKGLNFPLAYEQALLFGLVKRVSRERASERRSPRAPRVVLEAKNVTIDWDKKLLQCEEGGRQRE